MLKILRYIASFLLFYKLLNYLRNTFFVPKWYDSFARADLRRVIVIAPYYSKKGFEGSVCVFHFGANKYTSKPEFVDDPERTCLVVSYNIPDGLIGEYEYEVRKDSRVYFSKSEMISYTSRHTLSITTLFKYEVDFLREWIDHHITVGVEHFYLYENNYVADPRIAAVLKPFIKTGKVTHILWPFPYVFYNYYVRKLWPNDAHAYAQLAQINDALYRHGMETEWLLCCDVDEYFYSPSGNMLMDFVKDVSVDSSISSISVSGYWFGGSMKDLEHALSDNVVDAFLRSEREPTSPPKCFLRTSAVKLASVHNALIQDARGYDAPPHIMCFNHYRALGWQRRFDNGFATDSENVCLRDQVKELL